MLQAAKSSMTSEATRYRNRSPSGANERIARTQPCVDQRQESTAASKMRLRGSRFAATRGIFPASPDSALPASADYSSRQHGHTAAHETFSLILVAGPKRYRILPLEEPVWSTFHDVTHPWPQTMVSGQSADILLQARPTQDSDWWWPGEGSGGGSTASTLPDSSPAPRRVFAAR